MLNNRKIRDIIDTIGKKAVLILGRFSADCKVILTVIREEVRKKGYLPILFDFEKPDSRTFIETVSTLAHMSRFIIADISEAKLVLQEIEHVVRNISVPVKPLLKKGQNEPLTLYDLRINQRSLLDTYHYEDIYDIVNHLECEVIKPAEERAEELIRNKIAFNPLRK